MYKLGEDFAVGVPATSGKLAKLLAQENIPFEGNFRVLGYNPPYQLIDQKNEIIVRIDWKAHK